MGRGRNCATVVEELLKRVVGCSCRRDPAPSCDLGWNTPRDRARCWYPVLGGIRFSRRFASPHPRSMAESVTQIRAPTVCVTASAVDRGFGDARLSGVRRGTAARRARIPSIHDGRQAVLVWAGFVARLVVSFDFGPIGPILKDRTDRIWAGFGSGRDPSRIPRRFPPSSHGTLRSIAGYRSIASTAPTTRFKSSSTTVPQFRPRPIRALPTATPPPVAGARCGESRRKETWQRSDSPA